MRKHKTIHIDDCHRNFSKFRTLWHNLNSTDNTYTICTIDKLTPEEIFEQYYGAFKCFIERNKLVFKTIEELDDSEDFIEFDI